MITFAAASSNAIPTRVDTLQKNAIPTIVHTLQTILFLRESVDSNAIKKFCSYYHIADLKQSLVNTKTLQKIEIQETI